ncbi:MAG: GC-type dockerin domain-anchored protein [Planctomycetota bacterium]
MSGSSTLLTRFTACAGSVAAANAANGQIEVVDLGPVDGDISISGSNATGAIGLDFDSDGVVDMRIRRNLSSGRLKLFVDGDSANGQGNNEEDEIIAFAGGLNPIALSAGDLIGPSPAAGEFTFASNDNGALGNSEIWAAESGASSSEGDFPVDGVERFIGVRTVLDGTTHFGWIGIVLDEEQFSPLTFMNGYVSSIAYNTVPNEPIVAGDRGGAVDCTCDVNADTLCNGSDFFAWVSAFGAQAPECDVNADTLCNGSDFFAWVSAFGQGC